MAVNIQVRDVPEDVRARIVAHAADKGMSMQGYLLAMLTHLAARPTRADWAALAAVRELAPVDMTEALAAVRGPDREDPR